MNLYVPYPIDLDNYLAELTLPLVVTKGKVCSGSVSMQGLQHTANLFIDCYTNLSPSSTVSN
ncbi:hypothetical protein [Trichormus azollae]|uniref:hypothetical protein n=1 Tax=Trichormus azollae TaxID=1164 RepID=UPI00325FBCE8